MEKIQKIRLIWEGWKAAKMEAEAGRNFQRAGFIGAKLVGLEAALKILKEPPNTQIYVDTNKAIVCNKCGHCVQCQICGNTEGFTHQ